MIQLDNEKLQKVLKQVALKGYDWIEDKDNFYLDITEINFDFILSDEGKDYSVIGCYGYASDSDRKFSREFDILLNTDWTWDFIAGYFTAYLTLTEVE